MHREPSAIPQFRDKEYDSLYKELLEKCNPSRFYNRGYIDRQHFEIANEIYSVLQHGDATDEELIPLRNKAILELGIHFSTIRKYKYLEDYFNPSLYETRVPYNAELMHESGVFFERLLANRDDILALEQLELDASDFIESQNRERQRIIEGENIRRKRDAALERERERQIREYQEREEPKTIKQKIIQETAWLIPIIIDAIIVVGVITICYLLNNYIAVH